MMLGLKLNFRPKQSVGRRHESMITTKAKDKSVFCLGLLVALAMCQQGLPAKEMEWVRTGKDQRTFVLESGKPFVPWGFNYDHDEQGRLLEDYWEKEWPKVEEDFREMKQLGANVVRIHLQAGKFMTGPADSRTRRTWIALADLVALAEKTRPVPRPHGPGLLPEEGRAPVVRRLSENRSGGMCRHASGRPWPSGAADSPAIFCYDLMNEPVVPGGTRKPGDWLGPPFLGSDSGYFVQFITLEQKDRPRPAIARQWCHKLVAAIRKHDQRHLVTVGLVHGAWTGRA